MTIEWSGYNGSKGHEYIKITQSTTELLTIKAYDYQVGFADAAYSLGGDNSTLGHTDEYAPVCGQPAISLLVVSLSIS